MGWGTYLVIVVLAVGLGYVGAQVALVRERRRLAEPVPTAPEAPAEATFALEPLNANTFSLTNTGTASARFVLVVPLADGVDQWPPQPPPGSLTTATSDLLPTLAPGDTLSVWLSRHDRGQQVLVSWTSESNVRMGPITLDVPAP